jgi:hypothetical protein
MRIVRTVTIQTSPAALVSEALPHKGRLAGPVQQG